MPKSSRVKKCQVQSGKESDDDDDDEGGGDGYDDGGGGDDEDEEQREKVGEVCQTYIPAMLALGYTPRVASYITCTICCTIT